jgi:hypothetical protein
MKIQNLGVKGIIWTNGIHLTRITVDFDGTEMFFKPAWFWFEELGSDKIVTAVFTKCFCRYVVIEFFLLHLIFTGEPRNT